MPTLRKATIASNTRSKSTSSKASEKNHDKLPESSKGKRTIKQITKAVVDRYTSRSPSKKDSSERVSRVSLSSASPELGLHSVLRRKLSPPATKKVVTNNSTPKQPAEAPGSPIRTRSQLSFSQSAAKVADKNENSAITRRNRRNSSDSFSLHKSFPRSTSIGATSRSSLDSANKSTIANNHCSPRKTRSFRRQETEKDFPGLLKCLQCHNFKPLQTLRQCPNCTSPFHLTCLNFHPKALRYLETNKNGWSCPRCISCTNRKCDEYLTSADNIQCMVCTRAWHFECLPKIESCNRPKYPYNQWLCRECMSTMDDENCIRQRDATPPSGPLPAVPERIHKSKSTLQSSRKRLLSNNSLVHVKWSDRDCDDGDFIERRQTRSMKSESNESAKKKCKNVKPRLVEEKLDMNAVHERMARMKPKKLEEDGERSGAGNAVRQSTSSARNQEQYKPAAQVPNSPKSRRSGIGSSNMQLAEDDEERDLYAQQMRVLSEMGFKPEEKTNRNTRNRWLQFGQFVRFRPLYDSAYQQSIQSAAIIYVCEFCLTPMVEIDAFESHVMFCPRQYPPGNEIYRNANEGWNIWEVEGSNETNYCRNLCLMAKLFLSSKTLFHEVETFTFYILTEITPRGCVIVGYFSKEKNPSKNNNLSCLLTLPSAQGKGYGKLLIDLSYQLSKREHKIGSPEHPLSDLGLLAYRSYWRSVLFAAFRQRQGALTLSIKELSIETAIHSYDIVSTLLAKDMLRFRNDHYYIDINKALNASLASLRRRFIRPDQLHWMPPFDPNPYSKMNSYINTD